METYLQRRARKDLAALEGLARWHADADCQRTPGAACMLAQVDTRALIDWPRTAVAKAFTGELRADYLTRVEAAAALLLAHPTPADLH